MRSVWTYAYDAENRLIKMQQHSGGTLRLEFVYDTLGRRIEKSVYPTSGSSTPSSRTRFVYDGWNLIAELNALSSNAVLRTYTWGLDASGSLQGGGGVGGLLRMEEGGTAYHPVYDQSNNVTGLVRTSGTTATLVASYTYGPYGEKLQPDWAAGGYTDNNPFRYSTRYTDKETGLVYYGMRYYQPKTGRFINRDPIQEAGGLNLYTFVGNNPVNALDVLGLCAIRYEMQCTGSSVIPGSNTLSPFVCTSVAIFDCSSVHNAPQKNGVAVDKVDNRHSSGPSVAAQPQNPAPKNAERWSDEKCKGLAAQIGGMENALVSGREKFGVQSFSGLNVSREAQVRAQALYALPSGADIVSFAADSLTISGAVLGSGYFQNRFGPESGAIAGGLSAITNQALMAHHYRNGDYGAAVMHGVGAATDLYSVAANNVGHPLAGC